MHPADFRWQGVLFAVFAETHFEGMCTHHHETLSKHVIFLWVLKSEIDPFVYVVDVLLGDVDIAERDRLRRVLKDCLEQGNIDALLIGMVAEALPQRMGTQGDANHIPGMCDDAVCLRSLDVATLVGIGIEQIVSSSQPFPFHVIRNGLLQAVMDGQLFLLARFHLDDLIRLFPQHLPHLHVQDVADAQTCPDSILQQQAIFRMRRINVHQCLNLANVFDCMSGIH